MNSRDEKPDRRPIGKPESEARALVPIVGKVVGDFSGIPYVGPLVGALADLYKERKERLRESMQREADERLSDFFKEVLHDEARMDEEVALAMMDDADFHALARACVADIEAEKVGPYATLARGVASGKVRPEWRRHFILSLRDFSNAELQLLRKAFVANRHDLVVDGTIGSVRQQDVLAPGAPGSHQAILVSNLTLRGFVHDGTLSPVGELFTQACWREAQLTPAALGLRTWSGYNIPIINYEIGSGALDVLASKLQDGLIRSDVRSSIVALLRDNEQFLRTRSSMAILLVNGPSKHLLANLSVLIAFAKKVPTLLLEVASATDALQDVPVFARVICNGRAQSEVVDEVFAKLRAQSHAMTQNPTTRAD